MGGVDVSSVVTSIISAFGSGLDVLNRLRGKKRKNHARLPKPSEEEEWLRRSLVDRPIEIKKEYDQQVSRHGRHFEVGDGTTQSSLAHTLLVLNTGLINLINHALSADSRSRSASQKQLYNLSETAALDTMTALAQLGSRLSMKSPSRLALEGRDHPRMHEKSARKERQPSPPAKSSKRPPPSPLLVRGGWVRAKSGSTVSVVSASSARKVSADKGSKHHRSKSESAVSKNGSPTRQTKKTKRPHTVHESPTETLKAATGHLGELEQIVQYIPDDRVRPQRQPSMFIVPADFFEAQKEAPQQAGPYEAPPRPPKIPLHSRPDPMASRRRPVSTMTFMTASTKIGEIPESRFTDPQLAMASASQRPLPYTIPPPLEPVEPRKVRKGFKFWKREDKRQDVTAY
jgi:hypothetical protein